MTSPLHETPGKPQHGFDAEFSAQLYQILRELRKDLVKEAGAGCMAYHILRNDTLQYICQRVPRTKEELIGIIGLGKVKINKYGGRILETIEAAITKFYNTHKKDSPLIDAGSLPPQKRAKLVVGKGPLVSEKVSSPQYETPGKPQHEFDKEFSAELFRNMKELRKLLVREAGEGFMTYHIFGNTILQLICQRVPRTKEELLEIKGLGKVKINKYGDRILETIEAAIKNFYKIHKKDSPLIDAAIHNFSSHNHMSISGTCIIKPEVDVSSPIRKRKVAGHEVIYNSTYDPKKNDMPSGSIPLQRIALLGKSTRGKENTGVECAEPIPDDEVIILPAPTTHGGKIEPLPEYPRAGQLFEEGRHCKGILDEKFEDIGGFSVLKTHASLYKQIWMKYGHIVSSQVLTDSYSAQVTLVTEIMNYVMDIHQLPLAVVSGEMMESWEKKIKMAEKLEFNIGWFRERIDDVKKELCEKQELTTSLRESYQSLQVAKDELKKAQENVSSLESRINDLEMCLKIGYRSLFNVLL